MEKLHELHQEGRYDLLVLDTPPTRNALDFLDAPKQLAALHRLALAPVLHRGPALLGLKVFGRGTGVVFSVLKRVTGVDLLEDLSDFFSSFGEHDRGLPRARRARERAARRQPHRVPARHLAARGRDRRGGLLPPPPAGRGPAVRGRGGQPRAPERRAEGRRRRRSSRTLLGDDRWRARCCAPARTSAAWPSATARTWTT